MKNNLRKIREENGKTANDIALICGISKQLLNQYEISKVQMPVSFLKRISLLFNVNFYDILGESLFEYKGVMPNNKEDILIIKKYLTELENNIKK